MKEYLSKYDFPDPINADEEGIVCIGADLSPDTLLHAYSKGMFPWFNDDDPIIWWCPDPRFVLLPENLKISKSMKQIINKKIFHVTYNTEFKEVIKNCKTIKRTEQDGTWITNEMEEAYIKLHELGYAHSVEVWDNNELVGGLYGIRLGNVFFGESMFSKKSNASKYGFIQFVKEFQKNGGQIIDCQVHTSHLESLGAEFISRINFLNLIKKQIFIS